MNSILENILSTYDVIKDEIKKRLNEIKLETYDDYSLIFELFFCILTPQSKARNAGKIIEIIKNDISVIENLEKLSDILRFVRFKNNKASYIQYSYRKFKPYGQTSLKEIIENNKGDVILLRDIIVKEVKGVGYKEASHFLRNIGLGKDIAILDRHVLRIMRDLNIIDKIPNLNRREYIKVENKLKEFSFLINIPLDELDFLLWYINTKDIYK